MHYNNSELELKDYTFPVFVTYGLVNHGSSILVRVLHKMWFFLQLQQTLIKNYLYEAGTCQKP